MNRSSFTRKIIYIGLITALLIPLALIARPATRDPEGDKLESGGHLAHLRDEYQLSQAKLTEIDPASETMKLASLGLRGLAVNLLWMQAIEHKKKENWDQLESTLNALVKIQPNFIKVWEYQAHNLAYNLSVEFDDYEYRYHWVKKGIQFLSRGIKPNRLDHRMYDHLGFFTGMKIGVADEKKQFRRMFRSTATSEAEFRQSMSEWVEPLSYFTHYGHDNWAMAYQWYDRSRNLVDNTSDAIQKTSDIMYYRKRPSQLYSQAGAMQDDFRADRVVRETWRRANREWIEYGRIPIGNTLRQVVSLEELEKKNDLIEAARKELDSLAPEGLRDELIARLESNLEFSEEEVEALEIPTDQRSDEQESIAWRAENRISQEMARLDGLIVAEIPDEDRIKARRIGERIARLQADIRTIDKYKGTINYQYWRIRTKAEMAEKATRAWQLMYDAEELQRQSIFDDEYQINQETGEKEIVKPGAISTYLESYKLFADIIDQYPKLDEGELANRLLDSFQNYNRMLKVTGLEWPDDFPLQNIVDKEGAVDSSLGLMTSDEIRERRIERGESPGTQARDDSNNQRDDQQATEESPDDDTKNSSDDQAE